MKAYLQLLIDTLGWRIPVFLGMLLSLALMQGVGIVMLIPLLDILGDAGKEPTGISLFIMQFIAFIGLKPDLLSLLGLFLLVTIGIAGLKVFIQHYDQRLQHTLTEKLKTNFLDLVTHCQWTYFQQFKQAELHHTLTRDISRINYGFYLTVSMSSSIIVTIIYLLLALKISAIITVITCICGLLLVYGLRHKVRQAEIIGNKQFKSSREYHAVTSEHMENMKLVKSFGLEDKHLSHFSRIIKEMMRHQLELNKNNLVTRFYYEIGAVIALCSLIYASITVFQLATSELIVLVLVFSRLSPRFQQFQNQLQQFVGILPIHRGFVKQTDFLKQHQVRQEQQAASLSFEQQINFDGIYFRYPGNKKDDVLQDISFSIQKNATTAIIGPSGAGKSTLIDLLTGLHSPSRGSIHIDGQQLDKNNLPQWRQRLAYVTQEVLLFHDTLRNNLTWMTDEADDELLWQALGYAAADEFVNKLPHGLDTYLGDRGVILSGGEKQRIALARALVCQPELLILDEATSALDGQYDAMIQATLRQLRGKMTIVVIAHRLSSIQYTDQIVVIKQGRLHEVGGWQELMNEPDSYLKERVTEQAMLSKFDII